mmetsp:Transcript_126886/g.344488  ORF Transcript_126886/g.344488 Transcript_126886/m.344488 type:complete len:257 (+) Transcript_126886:127-897(+)
MSECEVSFGEFTPSASSGFSSSSPWANLENFKEQQAAFTDGDQMQAGLYGGIIFCMPVIQSWGVDDGWLHQEPLATPWEAYCDGFPCAVCEDAAAGAGMPEAHTAPQPPRRCRARSAAAPPPLAPAGGEPEEPVEPMPVRRTFIHFDTSDGRGPVEPADAEPAASSAIRSASAPPLLLRRTFCLRDPRKEEAHRTGDCKPCAYFLYKEDGCRLGDECSFCHLCVDGEVKRRKKEKHRVMKMQTRCARRGRQCRPER